MTITFAGVKKSGMFWRLRVAKAYTFKLFSYEREEHGVVYYILDRNVVLFGLSIQYGESDKYYAWE